jgi:hypothetical protein
VGNIRHEFTVSRDGSVNAEYRNFNFNINHEERTKARDQSVLALRDYYVYLIGWKKQSNQFIIALCREKIATWVYNVTSHDCQHFIREVAEEIISKNCEQKTGATFD